MWTVADGLTVMYLYSKYLEVPESYDKCSTGVTRILDPIDLKKMILYYFSRGINLYHFKFFKLSSDISPEITFVPRSVI